MKHLYRLSAFPRNNSGGNKAGVYLFADDLSDSRMQEIAKEVGYSETAFVMSSQYADFKVRFFTPLKEVDLCGHATIATFNLMRDLKIVHLGTYSQETKAGILDIFIDDDMVYMQQNKPIFSEIIPLNEISTIIDEENIDNQMKPQVVSTGLREIFIPVKNQDILNNFKPHFEEMIQLCERYNVIGIHMFSLDKDIDAYGRNFAPILGINEESATGTSNGALACYLYRYHQKKKNVILRQGYSMNLPSEIKVKTHTKNNQISEVWVGGKAKIIK